MQSRFASLLFAASFATACDAPRPTEVEVRPDLLPGVSFDLLSVDGQSLPSPWRLSSHAVLNGAFLEFPGEDAHQSLLHRQR